MSDLKDLCARTKLNVQWARGDSVTVEAYVRPAINRKRIRELPSYTGDNCCVYWQHSPAASANSFHLLYHVQASADLQSLGEGGGGTLHLLCFVVEETQVLMAN